MKWQQYVIPTPLQQDERWRQTYLDGHGPASTVCSMQQTYLDGHGPASTVCSVPQRNQENLASNKVEVDKRLTKVNLCLQHVHTCMHVHSDAQLNIF